MCPEKIIKIDLAPEEHVVLHEGDEAGPSRPLTLRHIVVLRQSILNFLIDALVPTTSLARSWPVI